ncbi:ATP-dependent acyl-CoA ligase [Ruicaihuangia caeni]|uniref:ATP-dependent acyl-CoA ligase n=1 Tax=Ruicaihuangia caeni TaxID=3042517 RepID=A0AAW6TAL9_9MICO|nr:ATP-dependent acyl-CoA ligase [Klugiella sp. YN-L-19]MDI2099023.1 ATP-dependent acyl-CoA ligase [Klugiella sp. YN-L-19]
MSARDWPLEECTIPRMLERRAEEDPDRPVLQIGELRRSVSEVRDAASAAGAFLIAEGVGVGDRVALIGRNRVELLDLILGCAWIGAVAVPINTASRGEQLHHILMNSGALLLICEADLHQFVRALPDMASLESVFVFADDANDVPPGTARLPRFTGSVDAACVAPSATAAILYTSGTTGVSKGVMCPHAQFYWWGRNVSTQLEITERDVLYTVLPLFHTNALNAFFQALFSGALYVLGERFSASRFWDQLQSTGATFTYLLGAMVSILMSRDPAEFNSAHRVTAALAPATPPDLLRPFAERFGVTLIDGYGSTETNSVFAASRTEQRPGSIGRLQPGFEARIVDPVGAELPPGEPGELLLRSSQPFAFASGYFGMPDKTVEAWQDLWFHTGDRLAADHDGWYRFVDRLKDVIRRRGENISSVEVESALRMHPSIADAAVYPVDSELGEDEVMAALVVQTGGAVDFDEVCEFLKPMLAYFAIPRFFTIVDALPLTENGKVRKGVLREQGTTIAQWDREAVAAVARSLHRPCD